jgi:hypothetical protein
VYINKGEEEELSLKILVTQIDLQATKSPVEVTWRGFDTMPSGGHAQAEHGSATVQPARFDRSRSWDNLWQWFEIMAEQYYWMPSSFTTCLITWLRRLPALYMASLLDIQGCCVCACVCVRERDNPATNFSSSKFSVDSCGFVIL